MNDQLKIDNSKYTAQLTAFGVLLIPFVFEFWIFISGMAVSSDPAANFNQGYLFSPLIDKLSLVVLIGIRVAIVAVLGNQALKNKTVLVILSILSAIPILGIAPALYFFTTISAAKRKVDFELDKFLTKEEISSRNSTRLVGNVAGCFLLMAVLGGGVLLLLLISAAGSGGSSSQETGGILLVGMGFIGFLLFVGGGLLIVYISKKR